MENFHVYSFYLNLFKRSLSFEFLLLFLIVDNNVKYWYIGEPKCICVNFMVHSSGLKKEYKSVLGLKILSLHYATCRIGWFCLNICLIHNHHMNCFTRMITKANNSLKILGHLIAYLSSHLWGIKWSSL